MLTEESISVTTKVERDALLWFAEHTKNSVRDGHGSINVFQLGRLIAHVDALATHNRDLTEAAKGLLTVVDESQGVIGWHLNGAEAPWGEFDFVDEFRAALWPHD